MADALAGLAMELPHGYHQHVEVPASVSFFVLNDVIGAMTPRLINL